MGASRLNLKSLSRFENPTVNDDQTLLPTVKQYGNGKDNIEHALSCEQEFWSCVEKN